MPQPNVREQIVRGPLQNVSIAYRNRSYIAGRIYPVIDGVDAKAKVGKFLKGAWFRDEADVRGPGSRAKRGGYPIGYTNVTLVERAFAKEVTDEDRRAAKSAMTPPLQPDEDAIEFATDKIDLRNERLAAADILGGTWCGVAGEDVEGLWAAGAGNTFVADVEARIETIRKNTGVRPTGLMLSANILPEIKQESSVLDRIKYTERGIVTAALIAGMFELEECVLGDAIYSSAEETAAGDDFTSVNVWEKNAGKGSAFLYYKPPRPGLKIVCAGLQARGRYDDGQVRRVTTWREAAEHQDVYEVAEETDFVQVCSYAGFLWYDCIAT